MTVKNANLWFILLASMLWGTTGTALTFAPAEASPFAVGALRLGIGGFSLLAFAAASGNLSKLSNFSFFSVIVPALCVALNQPLFFSGILHTGVIIGTIVAIGSAPIFSGVLAFILRGEKPGWLWALATFFALTGNLLLVFSKNVFAVNAYGVFFSLGAGFTYALFTTTSKGLLDKHPPVAITAIIFTTAAVFISPSLLVFDLGWLVTPNGLGVVLHLGFITAALAYSLFALGLAKTPVSTTVTLTLAEPLTASILGATIVHERLEFLSLFGVLLILAAIFTLFWGQINSEKRAKRSAGALQHTPQ